MKKKLIAVCAAMAVGTLLVVSSDTAAPRYAGNAIQLASCAACAVFGGRQEREGHSEMFNH